MSFRSLVLGAIICVLAGCGGHLEFRSDEEMIATLREHRELFDQYVHYYMESRELSRTWRDTLQIQHADSVRRAASEQLNALPNPVGARHLSGDFVVFVEDVGDQGIFTWHFKGYAYIRKGVPRRAQDLDAPEVRKALRSSVYPLHGVVRHIEGDWYLIRFKTPNT